MAAPGPAADKHHIKENVDVCRRGLILAALAAATLAIGALATAPTASALRPQYCVAFEVKAQMYASLGDVAAGMRNWTLAYYYHGLAARWWELAALCYDL